MSSPADVLGRQLLGAATSGNVPNVISLLARKEINVNWTDVVCEPLWTSSSLASHICHTTICVCDACSCLWPMTLTQFGRTPLSMACANGQKDVLEMLLRMPDIDVNKAGRVCVMTHILDCPWICFRLGL